MLKKIRDGVLVAPMPCDKVLVAVLTASGPRRSGFRNQLEKIRNFILSMRGISTSPPGAEVSRKIIEDDERVLGFALTFPESIAFNTGACF